MELENRFKQIKELLKEHQYLHEKEALERYGSEVPPPYSQWLKSLNSMNTSELLSLENSLDDSKLPQEYQELLHKIKELTSFSNPGYKSEQIDKELKRKFTKKKEHELSIIRAQIDSQSSLRDITSFADIGSGAAHLSSVLLKDNDKTSLCLDSNPDCQKIGITKLKKYFPEILKRVTFKSIFVNEETIIPIPADSLILGLHACGDLSKNIIELSSKNNFSLINYSCCYHKLQNKNLNISTFAKQDPLTITEQAKTMAAKSYKVINSVEDHKRKKVKYYRYALSIFLKDKLCLELSATGNGHANDYDLCFADYAKKFSPNTRMFSNEELNDFYKNELTETKIKRLLNLGILRSHFARLIECYIIVDRALYLQEKAHKVWIEETFERELSPRNLAIISIRRQ